MKLKGRERVWYWFFMTLFCGGLVSLGAWLFVMIVKGGQL